MLLEILEFFMYSMLIVIISKYILVILLRKLAETLNLKAKTIGNIAGVATSVPELLTISFSAYTGLITTTIFNVISSNIINFLQYLFSIFINKNQIVFQNKAIKIDIIIAVLTIIIPVLLLISGMEIQLSIVPVFLLLFIFFYYIDINVHKLYLNKQDKKIYEKIENEKKWLKGKTKKTVKYSVEIIITTIILFVVGNLLSGVLEELCIKFNVNQSIVGILLGIITSIPELITFIESQKYHKDKVTGVIEATNNLLSSNLLNLFIIQSIGIIIYYFCLYSM